MKIDKNKQINVQSVKKTKKGIPQFITTQIIVEN